MSRKAARSEAPIELKPETVAMLSHTAPDAAPVIPPAAKKPRKAKAVDATTIKKPKKTPATTPMTVPATAPTSSPTQPETKQPAPKRSKSADVPKKKRVHVNKEVPLDSAGIGIGPARVKKVLMNVALNPREFEVREAIHKAANPPQPQKPTAENPVPIPQKVDRVPVAQLPANILAVIQEAEEVHRQSLREDYEKEYLSKLTDEQKQIYQTKRKENKDLSLTEFNTKFDPKFYAGLETYVNKNDTYQVDEWKRASALVNKTCTRLSSETRNILAAYLDTIVIQYATNAINECVKDGRGIVKVRHALQDQAISMKPFVQTLPHYQQAVKWLATPIEDGKTNPYPNPPYDEDFDGYVSDICRSVRSKLATQNPACAEVSISSEFKRFCSNILYETILRIGSVLKTEVVFSSVKTVSDRLMFHAIRQIHSAYGLEFDSVQADITERLKKFSKWRDARRQKSKTKRQSLKSAETENESSEVEYDE